MLEPKTIEIDGLSYTIIPFPAIEALKIQRQLAEIIAGPIVHTFGSLTSLADIMGSKIDGSELSGAVSELFAKLPEAEFLALMKRLLKGVSVAAPNAAGQLQNFDFLDKFDDAFNAAFAGNLIACYKLVWEVLKVNFPDFFKMAPSIGRLMGITTTSGKGESEGKKDSSDSGTSGT